MELNKIYNEDCFVTMEKMPIGMLSVILTSPFYNTNKKQGNGRTLSNTSPKGYSYLRYDEHVDNMTDDDIGYDIGPDTIKKYKELLIDSKLVLWNGPLGMYEDDKYQDGTRKVMEFLYNQSIPTILAGGDITGASKKFGLQFRYVSTGGGSTLEYLEGKRFKTLERLNGEDKE